LFIAIARAAMNRFQ